jgi:DNA-binding response OmpR family regulator
MTARILIVDDDEALSALLVEYLARFGMSVQTAAHPQEAFRLLRTSPPDLLVLDVMLPGMDGFAVCKKVRETSRLPIVMLTARGDVTDRVVGLELGADDYVPKPFEPRELVARIQAVLRRRAPEGADEVLRAGTLEVNIATRTARLSGNDLALTTAELDILALLMRHAGRVLTRERLLEETRGVDWESYDRSIDVLVSRLRQKLGDDARRPVFIKTVRRTGYSFVGGGS